MDNQMQNYDEITPQEETALHTVDEQSLCQCVVFKKIANINKCARTLFNQIFKQKLIINGSKINSRNRQLLHQLFDEIQQIGLSVIIIKNDLRFQRRYSILNELRGIQFTNLKKLYLLSNGIKNIESLSLINSIQLKEIALDSNQIVCINALRKLNLKALKLLSLWNNPIEQISNLAAVNFSNKIQQLILDIFEDSDGTIDRCASWVGSNPNCLFKMQKIDHIRGLKKCMYSQRVYNMMNSIKCSSK